MGEELGDMQVKTLLDTGSPARPFHHSSMKILNTILLSAIASLSAPAVAQEATYTPLGTGCAGNFGVPLLEASPGSFPELDSTFTARLSNVPDGISIGILGLSATDWAGFPLPMNLNFLGMPGCTLYTNLLRTTELMSVGGKATWDTVLPASPALLGVSFFQQVLVFDSSLPGLGAVMSNAAEGTVGLERSAPRAEIIFPTFDTFTTAQSILVRGTASDPDGVAELRVNGLLAMTSDDFMNWQVRVPIDPGNNTLTIETRDTLGNADPQAAEARIESQARVQEVRGIAIDTPRNRALLVVTFPRLAIVTVDLTTTDRGVLSDIHSGIGPMFSSLDGIAIDLSSNRALVTDSTRKAVFAIDLATGDRTILADSQTGSGPVGEWQGIAIDGGRAFLLEPLSITSMDLVTGNRTRLSDANSGSGPMFANLRAIAVDGNRALVADSDLNSLLAVDLATGDRTVFTSGIGYPTAIVVDPLRNRALVMAQLVFGGRAMFAVDLLSGNHTLFSGTGAGIGFGFGRPKGIALEGGRAFVTSSVVDKDVPISWVVTADLSNGDRTRLWIPDGALLKRAIKKPALAGTRVLRMGTGSITSVDLATGLRTEVSGPSTGTGPELSGMRGMAADESHAYVTDADLDAVIAVDLDSSDRRVISDASTGNGPLIINPGPILLDGSRLLVMDESLAVIAVDLATGERTVISDASIGAGPALQQPFGMELDGTRLLVLEYFFKAIVAIDLDLGHRTMVASTLTGTGPRLTLPIGFAIDRDRALLVDLDLQAIVALDLTTGNRTLLSGVTAGRGPEFEHASVIVRDGTRAIVGDSRFESFFVVDIVTGERVFLAK